jgi:cyclic dehypoxanthinyl futalosine synthase
VFGYGPDEVVDLATRSGLSTDVVLDRLATAGLDGLPGAGAEVLVDRVRRQIAPRKATVSRWLSVLEAAHQRGLGGHASLLVGVGESREDQVEHLVALRELQDRSGGVTGIAVWPWVAVQGVVGSDASATGWLRAVAVSRLLLDNVNHVQVGWQGLGLDLAQAGLWMGADEVSPALLDGSAIVVRGTEVETVAELERHLKVAGFHAVRRDFWRVRPETESHAQL